MVCKNCAESMHDKCANKITEGGEIRKPPTKTHCTCQHHKNWSFEATIEESEGSNGAGS